ncbi:MAG TPA: DUF3300 domain-containing protein [Stellaceae bacterium]|nr:DUF3300 domain-containing protein [Xanthobacteraceae bacterium]HXP05640.1 DUF3300 domain-containing protein [Stellaceae bacterium]
MSGYRGLAVVVGLTAGLVCGGVENSSAQDMPSIMAPLAPVPVAPVQPVAPVKPVVSIPAAQQLTEAQLDQLVAPIALYPDPLLGQMLIASTYPQDVSEAARWARIPANRTLGGDALTAAMKAKGWNPSVMALAPFPSLLAIMADKLDWTEQLGGAFVAQQGEVMAAVQHLRHAALAAGNLKATPECHCVIQTSGDIIAIQPSDTDLVSVPVYDPAVTYGSWAAATYPPATFPIPQGFVFPPGKGVAFNPAIDVALFGPIWGWESIDWPNRRIVVHEARYAALQPGHAAFAGGAWVHEAAPPRRVVHNAPSVVTHPSHHAKSAAMRRFAMTHPPTPYPPYWSAPRYHVWALPPGTIVPPPPPPRHVARDWYAGYYDRYR